MTNRQGTEWETEIVRTIQELDTLYHSAGRYPKRAQKGEPDVWIGVPESRDPIPIVAWKRLVKTGGKRRAPDGERAVVVIGWEDFQKMLDFLPFMFEVQAKWTERLNVTRTLHELRTWLRENR